MPELVQLNVFEKFESEPLTIVVSGSETLLSISARNFQLHENLITISSDLGTALFDDFALAGSGDGSSTLNRDLEISKNESSIMRVRVVRIDGNPTDLPDELPNDFRVDENPGMVIGDQFDLQFLTVNLKQIVAPNVLDYPLNKKLVETLQWVIEVQGEDQLQSALRVYDVRTNQSLDDLLISLGVKDMVYEIADNPSAINEVIRGITVALNSFFRIKGTMQAVWYCLHKKALQDLDGPDPIHQVVEWYEGDFLPLEPGDSLDDLRGCIDVILDPDNLTTQGVSMGEIKTKFEALGVYLLPWFLHVYRWILLLKQTESFGGGFSETFKMFQIDELDYGEFTYGDGSVYGGDDEDQVV